MTWRPAIVGVAGCLSLLASTQASASFPDVSAGYESRRAVEYLHVQGVLQGYADGLFRPAFPINRAEFLKVLIAAKGVTPDPAAYGRCFPDVEDQWYAPYVCYARSQDWVQGYPDGTFGPERPVSFAESIKMLMNVRGYPPAPAEEVSKRGMDPDAWFAPYLTTALLTDVVSYGQVWGEKALPLQARVSRGFVAQLLYRSMLAEGSVTVPLAVTACATFPTALEIRTYVDVAQPSQTNVYRQEMRGLDGKGGSCVLAADANPFGRVTPAFDPFFLQPYPAGQPAKSWTATSPLFNGRAVLRGAALGGALRPEVFLVDTASATIRQLSPVFASQGGSMISADGRYAVYVGAAGQTLEALDLVGGESAVLAVLEAPRTFFSSPKQGQDVSFSPDAPAVVRYTTYDAAASSGGGYAVVETKTVDVAASFGRPTVDPLFPDGLTIPDAPIVPSDPLFPDDPLFSPVP